MVKSNAGSRNESNFALSVFSGCFSDETKQGSNARRVCVYLCLNCCCTNQMEVHISTLRKNSLSLQNISYMNNWPLTKSANSAIK